MHCCHCNLSIWLYGFALEKLMLDHALTSDQPENKTKILTKHLYYRFCMQSSFTGLGRNNVAIFVYLVLYSPLESCKRAKCAPKKLDAVLLLRKRGSVPFPINMLLSKKNVELNLTINENLGCSFREAYGGSFWKMRHG